MKSHVNCRKSYRLKAKWKVSANTAEVVVSGSRRCCKALAHAVCAGSRTSTKASNAPVSSSALGRSLGPALVCTAFPLQVFGYHLADALVGVGPEANAGRADRPHHPFAQTPLLFLVVEPPVIQPLARDAFEKRAHARVLVPGGGFKPYLKVGAYPPTVYFALGHSSHAYSVVRVHYAVNRSLRLHRPRSGVELAHRGRVAGGELGELRVAADIVRVAPGAGALAALGLPRHDGDARHVGQRE